MDFVYVSLPWHINLPVLHFLFVFFFLITALDDVWSRGRVSIISLVSFSGLVLLWLSASLCCSASLKSSVV